MIISKKQEVTSSHVHCTTERARVYIQESEFKYILYTRVRFGIGSTDSTEIIEITEASVLFRRYFRYFGT